LRGSFNRSTHPSPLVRQLGEESGFGAPAPSGQDFAERLGAWLSVADAIALRTALQTIPSTRPLRTVPVSSNTPASLAEELQRVRATLTKSITTVDAPPPPRGRADRSVHASTPAPVLPIDPSAEFAMLHQRYGEQQRRMEMSVDALRAHARQVLSQTSPELARLAALDGVVDKMLGGREQHVLSTVPAFLKKRFEQMRRQAAAEEAANAQTPLGAGPEPSTTQQSAWLVQLAAEFEQALLAELDLRLQPIAGMVDALEHANH
jgi:hypothetical protein